MKVNMFNKDAEVFNFFDKVMHVRENILPVLNTSVNILNNCEVYPEGMDRSALSRATEIEILSMLIKQLISNAAGFKLPSQDFNFIMRRLTDNAKVFDVTEFMKNEYFANINIPSITLDRFKLTYSDYKEYELFQYGVPTFDERNCISIPRIGSFNGELKFPLLVQKDTDTVWMSVTPNEVETMKEPIKNAKGRVLTFGLGLGYFTYMAGIKPEVESVTVVEKEQSVIDLFEQYILPQFSCKDKIKIIKADAFDYIKSMDESDFDYCFVDIWDSVADFDVFFKSVEAIRERKFKELKIDFWILESFCTYLTEMYLNTIHYKVLSRMFASFGVDIPAMLPDEPTLMPPETARLEKYVGKLLEGKVFRTPEDVKRCISPKNIAKDIFASDIIFSKC